MRTKICTCWQSVRTVLGAFRTYGPPPQICMEHHHSNLFMSRHISIPATPMELSKHLKSKVFASNSISVNYKMQLFLRNCYIILQFHLNYLKIYQNVQPWYPKSKYVRCDLPVICSLCRAILFSYTVCPNSPVTEFRGSSLSFSYMKTTHHGLLQLTHVIPVLLSSSHAKKNFEIFIFYPFFNFCFQHQGNHLVNFLMAFICDLQPTQQNLCLYLVFGAKARTPQ